MPRLPGKGLARALTPRYVSHPLSVTQSSSACAGSILFHSAIRSCATGTASLTNSASAIPPSASSPSTAAVSAASTETTILGDEDVPPLCLPEAGGRGDLHASTSGTTPTTSSPCSATHAPPTSSRKPLSEEDRALFIAALNGTAAQKDIAAAEHDGIKRLGGAGVGITSGELLLAFTCNACEHRSVKRFTRHSYEKGIVVVQCPGCQNKHLIADHLGWFEDSFKTIEDVMRVRGEEMQKIGMADLITFS